MLHYSDPAKQAKMALCDTEIVQAVKDHEMITPFVDRKVSDGVLSYGLSSYGYDARIGSQFIIFTESLEDGPVVIDPKSKPHPTCEQINVEYDEESDTWAHFAIPAKSFALTHTLEYFKIPEDTISICMGKSTYARCGLNVIVTPLEPGWEGQVTLELHNTTSHPIRIYINEGVCQFIFLRGTPCKIPYEKNGKYQHQLGITPACVKSINKEDIHEAGYSLMV